MNWLDGSITAALARALVHFIWEAALIAGLLAIMLSALRRASAEARYLAACVALAVMTASFAATFASSFGGRPSFPVFSAVAAAIPDPSAAMAGGGPPDFRPFGPWAVAIWMSGVMLLLARRTSVWLQSRNLLRRAAVLADSVWLSRLEGLCRLLDLKRHVSLFESALVECPAVVGWLRPVILLPAGWLLQIPPEQAEAVLLHELAHVRRHDYLVNLLQSVVEDLLFYHPAVWWVGRVIRRERENCCDDAVIAAGGNRREYARTLASLEGMRADAASLAASGGSLAERIRRLVRPPAVPRASVAPLLIAVALVCAGAAVLPAWQTPPPQKKADSPYEKWLSADAAYIIMDAERAAFLRLPTNEEREHFIEQFWQRRDPTPGTIENEFKEEHYRRIAYANEKFAEAGLAGWKTDRGRIYIVYGPSDEKEVHPAGERGGSPFEEWMYYRIEGIGQNVIVRFEDTQRNGHFTMTSDPNAKRPPKAQAKPAEGDLFYQADGATVQVGEKGATMMSVPFPVMRVHLVEVVSGGGIRTVWSEGPGSTGSALSKLLVLPAGQYRLEGDSLRESGMRRERLHALESQLAVLHSSLNELRRTYTDQHPQVLQAQSQLAEVEHLLESARTTGPDQASPFRLDFRVP